MEILSGWIISRYQSTQMLNFQRDLKANMEMITDFYNALEEIEFSCDKRTDEFNENNWKAVTKLINVYHRKIKLKEDDKSEWYIWWWDEK